MDLKQRRDFREAKRLRDRLAYLAYKPGSQIGAVAAALKNGVDVWPEWLRSRIADGLSGWLIKIEDGDTEGGNPFEQGFGFRMPICTPEDRPKPAKLGRLRTIPKRPKAPSRSPLISMEEPAAHIDIYPTESNRAFWVPRPRGRKALAVSKAWVAEASRLGRDFVNEAADLSTDYIHLCGPDGNPWVEEITNSDGLVAGISFRLHGETQWPDNRLPDVLVTGQFLFAGTFSSDIDQERETNRHLNKYLGNVISGLTSTDLFKKPPKARVVVSWDMENDSVTFNNRKVQFREGRDQGGQSRTLLVLKEIAESPRGASTNDLIAVLERHGKLKISGGLTGPKRAVMNAIDTLRRALRTNGIDAIAQVVSHNGRFRLRPEVVFLVQPDTVS